MGHLSPEQKQALLDSPAIYYGSTDYMKRIFDAGVSPQQQYSVNISGGTEKVAFFTSVGYSNQKSLTNDFGFSDAASNSGSHKYNFRTNFDFNIIPLTEINVSLSGQVRETKIITDRNSSVDMWGRYRDLMLNIYEAPPFSAPGCLRRPASSPIMPAVRSWTATRAHGVNPRSPTCSKRHRRASTRAA